MAIDPKEIGRRIGEARVACGLTVTDLANEVRKVLEARAKSDTTKRGKPATVSLTRQTVSNWEGGRPQLDMLSALAQVFVSRKPEYDEAYLVFGEQRSRQLEAERPHLVYLDQDEAQLIQIYRHIHKQARPDLVAAAETIQRNHPAPLAAIKSLSGNSNTKGQ